ncbi:hypothetical protein EMPS_07314 [Entomortierella parvispora]|uniref:Uncharacterized protein n=1 Tax=Entomortierella parvispora TaxID=205924 RepID=A0A9P3HE70_9FUNG|nr:hypothetical protein EMPS_07314 [Entomortierella parvispora]
MICDPTILEQSRWVCSNLTHFAVKPKCDGGGLDYTAEEAQEAFMKQVGSLKRIQVLDFEPDKIEDDSFGFKPEKSLSLLDGMSELEDVNLGVQANKRMDTVHADQMLRMWPKLRRLYGFPENTVAGNYVKGLQSKVSVGRRRMG